MDPTCLVSTAPAASGIMGWMTLGSSIAIIDTYINCYAVIVVVPKSVNEITVNNAFNDQII